MLDPPPPVFSPARGVPADDGDLLCCPISSIIGAARPAVPSSCGASSPTAASPTSSSIMRTHAGSGLLLCCDSSTNEKRLITPTSSSSLTAHQPPSADGTSLTHPLSPGPALLLLHHADPD